MLPPSHDLFVHRCGTSSVPPPASCHSISDPPQRKQRSPPPRLLGVTHSCGGQGVGGTPQRVLLVNLETQYELHTTQTLEIMRLDGVDMLFPQSGTTRDMVMGVLDTGVWSKRVSYDDVRLGPVTAG
ncbi:Subtilisin-like protease SBT1.7 [Hordeum vulgare]|nr:Subtilisin-like protease SBT1.7 [Hordeum vulgare]